MKVNASDIGHMRIPVSFIHALSDWLYNKPNEDTLTLTTRGGNVYTFEYKEVTTRAGTHLAGVVDTHLVGVIDMYVNKGED